MFKVGLRFLRKMCGAQNVNVMLKFSNNLKVKILESRVFENSQSF